MLPPGITAMSVLYLVFMKFLDSGVNKFQTRIRLFRLFPPFTVHSMNLIVSTLDYAFLPAPHIIMLTRPCYLAHCITFMLNAAVYDRFDGMLSRMSASSRTCYDDAIF